MIISTITILSLGMLLAINFWQPSFGPDYGNRNYKPNKKQEKPKIQIYERLYEIWDDLDELRKNSSEESKVTLNNCMGRLEELMEKMDF